MLFDIPFTFSNFLPPSEPYLCFRCFDEMIKVFQARKGSLLHDLKQLRKDSINMEFRFINIMFVKNNAGGEILSEMAIVQRKL